MSSSVKKQLSGTNTVERLTKKKKHKRKTVTDLSSFNGFVFLVLYQQSLDVYFLIERCCSFKRVIPNPLWFFVLYSFYSWFCVFMGTDCFVYFKPCWTCFFNHLHRNMCTECAWGHKTFLVQLYWHLTIKLYLHHDNLAFLYASYFITVTVVVHFVNQKRV